MVVVCVCGGVPGGLDSPLGTKFYALNRKMTKQIKFEKHLVEQKLKITENLGKKELAAAARQRLPPQKKPKFRGPFWKYSGHNCPFNP